MYANRQNFRVRKEIGVEEHDGDVRFKSGSGNTAVSCIRKRNASDHNYKNSSVIVDLAMGQIPQNVFLVSFCFRFSRVPIAQFPFSKCDRMPFVLRQRINCRTFFDCVSSQFDIGLTYLLHTKSAH